MTDIRTTGVLDSFIRSPESPLASPWAQSGVVGAPLDLTSNRVTHHVGSGTGSSYWTTEQFDGDVEVWAGLNGGGADGIAWALELLSAVGSGAADGYRARNEVASGVAAGIYRVDNSATTAIVFTGGSIAAALAGDMQLLRYVSATGALEFWQSNDSGSNWTMLCSIVDGTYVPPFYLSLGIRDNSNSQILAWVNFGGGSARRAMPGFIRRPWRTQTIPPFEVPTP